MDYLPRVPILSLNQFGGADSSRYWRYVNIPNITTPLWQFRFSRATTLIALGHFYPARRRGGLTTRSPASTRSR